MTEPEPVSVASVRAADHSFSRTVTNKIEVLAERDDRLQRHSQGYAVPESFTHGTSAQRVRWFMAGFKSGDVGSCDTFSARDL